MKSLTRLLTWSALAVAGLACLFATKPEGKPDISTGHWIPWKEDSADVGIATVYFSQGISGSSEYHIGLAGQWVRVPDVVLVQCADLAVRVQKALVAGIPLPIQAILAAYTLAYGFSKAFPGAARRHLAVSRANLRGLRVYTVYTACVCHIDFLQAVYSAVLLMSLPKLDRPVHEVYFTTGGIAACLTTFMTRSAVVYTDTGSGSFSTVPLFGSGGALAGVFAYAAFMDATQSVMVGGLYDVGIGVVLTVHLAVEIICIARGLNVVSHAVGAVCGVALAIGIQRWPSVMLELQRLMK